MWFSVIPRPPGQLSPLLLSSDCLTTFLTLFLGWSTGGQSGKFSSFQRITHHQPWLLRELGPASFSILSSSYNTEYWGESFHFGTLDVFVRYWSDPEKSDKSPLTRQFYWDLCGLWDIKLTLRQNINNHNQPRSDKDIYLLSYSNISYAGLKYPQLT